MEEQLITKEGYEKLKNELENLLKVKRPEIAKRIEIAKELGDLSENAEYHEAKDSQAFNDGRIMEIQAILKNVKIVDSNGSKNKVSMGSTVEVKFNGEKREFKIVSFNEAEPSEGLISNESPLGLAFLGRKKDDEVEVNTPKGIIKYKILNIK
jgi:transcription elongation factor GreA